MTHFGDGEGKQGTGGRRFLMRGRLSGEYPGRCANTCQAGLNDHDERNVPIPGRPTSDLVILQAHIFPYLETFFNSPSLPNCFDHFGKCGADWSKDEVVGFLARIVQTTTDEQKVLLIIFTPMQHRLHCPIEESWPFRAVAHRKSLPIACVK